ncbi:5-hydroxytryptamine receptor 1A-alpha-like [Dendronephthya gigantea]|uniref:5-hydroxytryptamine receptor 1A-alpha-like n=1 Tax=Dendronephthya gigantea TaxID=151771 RepID=UPI00106ABDDE|nr:5-hydroxytryptamine receptor 1A-alpha-like [Dendronephthya gigantea]
MAATNGTDALTYSRFWEQFHAGFLILVSVTALFGNGFVCTAVYKVRRLQKVSNYFLVSLAVSDILVVVLAIPFRIYFELNTVWLLGKHACKFWIFMDILCNTASIVNLSLISVDRYIALSKSLRYLAIATVSRCRIGIAIVWGFSFTIATLSLHTWSSDGGLIHHPFCRKNDKIYYTFSTILGIIIPLVVLIVLYYLVFKIALKHHVKIMKSNYSTPPSSEDCADQSQLRSRSNSSPRRFAIRELKATKTLIIVVGAFLVCWLPLCVLVVMQQYVPQYIERWPPKTQEILGQLLLYSLPFLNSCLNPYIYTCHNSEFRAVFKKTFSKMLPFLKSRSKKETKNTFCTENDFVSTGV